MFDILLPRYDMALRQLDDLFECGIEPSAYSSACECGDWTPASNITETDKHYMVTMEVPGVDMKKIDISYNDGELTVKGEKLIDAAELDASVCTERFAGTFDRTFVLPRKVNADKIEATYKDGILGVTLPKTEESMTKKIVVH
jgi:HSP20 family protein